MGKPEESGEGSVEAEGVEVIVIFRPDSQTQQFPIEAAVVAF